MAPTMGKLEGDLQKLKGENQLMKEEIRLLKEENRFLKEQRDFNREKALQTEVGHATSKGIYTVSPKTSMEGCKYNLKES